MKYQIILFKEVFGLKGAVHYEAIATVIFSHVKISSFAQKLTWYFIGVYMIKTKNKWTGRHNITSLKTVMAMAVKKSL